MNDLDLRDLVLEEHLLCVRKVVERKAWSAPGVSKVKDCLLIA
ncbi:MULTISPECIES: hypothetical protein [Pseudomonas]|nr:MULTISPECIES: hypothetical protein [Pseudomonas]